MLEICPLAALPRGEARRVDADPPIAVFHTDDGEVFAIDDTCTHQDASLADGWLEGCEIECPLHASRFNLRTGEVDAPPAKLPVRTHEVVDRRRRDQRRPRRRPAQPSPRRHHPRGRRGGTVKSVAVVGPRWRDCRRPARCARRVSTATLTIVGDEARRPYDRPPLSKEFLAGDVGEDALALEADDDDLNAQWLLGVHATRLDAAAGAVHLDDGTAVCADGIVVATGARARSWPGSDAPRRSARAAHGRRRAGPARRTAPGRAAGGDRRRLHRWRSRLHRNEIGPGRHGGRGRAGAAGRPARRATRRRGRAGCTPSTAPGCCAARRLRASPAATGSPACNWPTAVSCPPTSSWSASARSPTSSGCATARSNWPTASCATQAGRRQSRTWSRSATVRPGMSRRVGWPHRVEHWTGALERPAIAVATLLAGAARRHAGQTPVLLVRSVRPPHPVRRHRRARR